MDAIRSSHSLARPANAATRRQRNRRWKIVGAVIVPAGRGARHPSQVRFAARQRSRDVPRAASASIRLSLLPSDIASDLPSSLRSEGHFL